jgi:hypothetical protein
MRHQIQRHRPGADEHLASQAVEAADVDKGVTALEFEQKAMKVCLENYEKPTKPGEPTRPKSNVPFIKTAIIEQSQQIRQETVPAGGIPATRTGNIRELQRRFPDQSDSAKEVRVDIENNFGHNLKELR